MSMAYPQNADSEDNTVVRSDDKRYAGIFGVMVTTFLLVGRCSLVAVRHQHVLSMSKDGIIVSCSLHGN